MSRIVKSLVVTESSLLCHLSHGATAESEVLCSCCKIAEPLVGAATRPGEVMAQVLLCLCRMNSQKIVTLIPHSHYLILKLMAIRVLLV